MQSQSITLPEEWRPVVGYEGIYEVSSLGRVRRLKAGKGTRPDFVLRPIYDSKGYAHVALHDGKRRDRKIHSLVAEAFIGLCPDGHGCNHRDGVKSNNAPSNLEWATNLQNIRHAIANGLMPSRKGQRTSRTLLDEDKVRAIRALLETIPQYEIANRFAVSRQLISAINMRKVWGHVE